MDNYIKLVMNDLEAWAGIIPPIEELSIILSSDEHCMKHRKFYSNASELSGLDTMDRDDVMDAVSLYLVGKLWPTYGDGVNAMKTFQSELKNSCDEKIGKLSNFTNHYWAR